MLGESKSQGMEILRNRLEAWRSAKAKQEPIPEEIWEMAVAQARQHSVGLVSKDLGLSHSRLKARLASKIKVGREANGGGFVELINLVGRGPMHVEVSRPDGCQIRIALGVGLGTEAASIVRAFLG